MLKRGVDIIGESIDGKSTLNHIQCSCMILFVSAVISADEEPETIGYITLTLEALKLLRTVKTNKFN